MSYLLSLLLCISLSPIWPLGDNPRAGDPFIIVNKQTNKLAYIDDGKIQKVFPVATGKTNDLTPEGTFDIILKAKNPYYIAKNIPGGSPKILLVQGGWDLMREVQMVVSMVFMVQISQVQLENIFHKAVFG